MPRLHASSTHGAHHPAMVAGPSLSIRCLTPPHIRNHGARCSLFFGTEPPKTPGPRFRRFRVFSRFVRTS